MKPLGLCVFLATLILSVSFSRAYFYTNEVLYVPGYRDILDSRIFSGYLPVTAAGECVMHYWFIESFKEPANSPVMLWLQGGPGASGAMGLFTEFGPFNVNDASFSIMDDHGVPQVFRNENTFSRFANLLIIEAPATVGYSFCKKPLPVFDDATTADGNLEFLVRFFRLFPEYAKNDFYIAGESYAGIYVPMLASLVLMEPTINLKGVIVGNGCTGLLSEGGCGKDEEYWRIDFLHGHRQISDATYQQLMRDCVDGLRDKKLMQEDCKALLAKAKDEAGPYFEYGLYDRCFGENDLVAFQSSYFSLPSFPKHSSDYPCGAQKALNYYMAHTEVKRAFHIPQDVVWTEHDGNWDLYNSTEEDVTSIYKTLNANGVRVLIYYGDTDTSVPYNGGEHWVNQLGLRQVIPFSPFPPSYSKMFTVGHYQVFDGDFTLATIRGAGHMVPQMKPEAASLLMKWFLFGELDFDMLGVEPLLEVNAVDLGILNKEVEDLKEKLMKQMISK